MFFFLNNIFLIISTGNTVDANKTININSDASVRELKGPTRPVSGEQDRAFLLACFSFVDLVVIFDSPRCDREIAALAPEGYAKGGDYTVESLDSAERNALLA